MVQKTRAGHSAIALLAFLVGVWVGISSYDKEIQFAHELASLHAINAKCDDIDFNGRSIGTLDLRRVKLESDALLKALPMEFEDHVYKVVASLDQSHTLEAFLQNKKLIEVTEFL